MRYSWTSHFLTFLFLIAIYSCNQNSKTGDQQTINDQDITTKVVKYKDGSIKKRQTFLNDSIQHGKYKKYYKNGQLKVIIPYHKNKKHGISKGFYRSGELKFITRYDSGVNVDSVKWYYKNGTMEAFVEVKNGQKFGNAMNFYENGNVKAYAFYNLNEKVKYFVEYDRKGNIVNEKGLGFPNTLYNSDTLTVGDTFRAEVNIINPPHGEPNLFIVKYNKEGKFIGFKQVVFKDNKYNFEYSWDEPGRYKFTARLEMNSDLPKAKREFLTEREITIMER